MEIALALRNKVSKLEKVRELEARVVKTGLAKRRNRQEFKVRAEFRERIEGVKKADRESIRPSERLWRVRFMVGKREGSTCIQLLSG
jgi:hypothetical protein